MPSGWLWRSPNNPIALREFRGWRGNFLDPRADAACPRTIALRNGQTIYGYLLVRSSSRCLELIPPRTKACPSLLEFHQRAGRILSNAELRACRGNPHAVAMHHDCTKRADARSH